MPLPRKRAASSRLPLAVVPFSSVQKFETEVIHALSQFFDRTAEVVVHDCRGDRREQTESCSEERFADAGADGGNARGSRGGLAQDLKRVDDADDRAEQADEGRDGGRGREPAHVLFKPGDFFICAELEAAFESQGVRNGSVGVDLAYDLGISELKDGRERCGSELLGRRGHGIQARCFAEGPQELVVGVASPAERAELGEEDRKGEERESQQDDHDGLRDRSRARNHVPDVYLRENDCQCGFVPFSRAPIKPFWLGWLKTCKRRNV